MFSHAAKRMRRVASGSSKETELGSAPKSGFASLVRSSLLHSPMAGRFTALPNATGSSASGAGSNSTPPINVRLTAPSSANMALEFAKTAVKPMFTASTGQSAFAPNHVSTRRNVPSARPFHKETATCLSRLRQAHRGRRKRRRAQLIGCSNIASSCSKCLAAHSSQMKTSITSTGDATTTGLKISSFGRDRSQQASGRQTITVPAVAATKRLSPSEGRAL